jgi:hypothetical protein
VDLSTRRCVDTSMTPEDRVVKTKKLLELLIKCSLRADREQSTVQAGVELLSSARKILKGFKLRDECLDYLSWPAFTSQKNESRKKARYVGPETPTQYAVAFPQQTGVSVMSPQPFANTRPFCPVCAKFGHTESTCFQKHPELRNVKK